MEKVTSWLLIGLLAYISFTLTAIDRKIDTLELAETQFTVMDEVKNTSFTTAALPDVRQNLQSPVQMTPAGTGIYLGMLAGFFVIWHISKIYHLHQWTNSTLRKKLSHYKQTYVVPAQQEALHPDQECAGLESAINERIKDSWLPENFKRLDQQYDGAAPRSNHDLRATSAAFRRLQTQG